MKRIVFVCTGNICRSPMAEGLLRHKWAASGREDLIVTSMGVSGLDNDPATDFAKAVCLEHGFDISRHRSRSIAGDELKAADLILCMEPVHREFVKTFFPWYQNKIFLLGAWPEKETRKSGIEDPVGGSLEMYRKTFSVIETHIDRILPLLCSP